MINFSLINSDFSFKPILPSFMNNTFGKAEFNLIVWGLSLISFKILSIDNVVTEPNSTFTSPCRSFIYFIPSFLQMIRISANASKLETSSGIGPNLSDNSATTFSNSASVITLAIFL